MIPNYQYDEISFSSLKKDVCHYSWETFRADASAGLTVALLTVPQAMAYALVAGLPLTCALFSAIFSTVIAAIFGSSRHLVVGPSNAIAILIQSGTAEVLFTYYRDVTGIDREILSVQILTQLTLLVGIVHVVVALCKLGRLTQFVSHSVVIGYIAGTVVAVVISQLFTFFGIPRLQGVYSLYERGVYVLTHLQEIHWPTTLIGIGSVFTLVLTKKLNRRLPAGVMTLISAGVIVHILGLSSYHSFGLLDVYADFPISNVLLVGDLGDIYQVIPGLELPFFNTAIMNKMLPFAFAVALLSILETSSVAKSIAASSGQRLSFNQEIFGLGVANFFASFIGAMPASGSPSRSALIYNNGGKTRFASIINGILVAAILMMFGFFVTRIPLSALSAIVLVNVTNIVNMRQFLLCLKATSSDAFVLMITLFSCLIFSLDIAFYIGVVISITLYLKKAAIPHLVECTFDETGKIGAPHFSNKHEHKKVRMINVQGELFFGAADLFQTTLKSIAEDDDQTKVIILRLKNARDIDATACLALQQLYDYLKGSKRYLIACSLTHQSWEVLCDSGIVELIGKDNLFILDERNPLLSVQKALNRANELISQDSSPQQLESVQELSEVIEAKYSSAVVK